MPRNNQLTWCPSCTEQTYEDVLHCIWLCSSASPVWAWLTSFIQNAVPNQHRNIAISPGQALLGEPLAFHPRTPTKWWQIIRAVGCWYIWKSRCTRVFDEVSVTVQETMARIWFRLKLYLRIEWRKLATAVRSGKITLAKARWHFTNDFGLDPLQYCTYLWGCTLV